MGEAVNTIPSILNKCLFVSPDRRTPDHEYPISSPMSRRSKNGGNLGTESK